MLLLLSTCSIHFVVVLFLVLMEKKLSVYQHQKGYKTSVCSRKYNLLYFFLMGMSWVIRMSYHQYGLKKSIAMRATLRGSTLIHGNDFLKSHNEKMSLNVYLLPPWKAISLTTADFVTIVSPRLSHIDDTTASLKWEIN